MRMTNREFKKILKDAGMDFSVYGYEGILNKLSILSDYERRDYKEKGNEVLAKLEYDSGEVIYEALKNRGYYDSEKKEAN